MALKAHEAINRVWSILGLFARAEGFVDHIVDRQTASISGRLAKIVLKRLSADDRRRCLVTVLDEAGLSAVYPDLALLFAEVAKFRNDAAHAHVSIHIDHSKMEDDRSIATMNRDLSELPFKVGLAKGLGFEGDMMLEVEDIVTMHQKAYRLVGLLRTLTVDLGYTRFRDPHSDRTDPASYRTGVEVLGPVDPAHPREPRHDF